MRAATASLDVTRRPAGLSLRGTEHPRGCGVEVGGQVGVVGSGRSGEGSHNYQRPTREAAEAVPHEVTEPTFHTVADDRIADRPGNDEAHPRRVGAVGSHGIAHGRRLSPGVGIPIAPPSVGSDVREGRSSPRVARPPVQMDDEGTAPGTTATSHGEREVR